MQRSTTEVGRLVAARRRELGLRQADLPGVSIPVISKIEVGRHTGGLQPHTARAVTAALGWPADALDQLAAGVDPDQLAGPTATPPPAATAEQLTPDELHQALEQLAHTDPGAYRRINQIVASGRQIK